MDGHRHGHGHGHGHGDVDNGRAYYIMQAQLSVYIIINIIIRKEWSLCPWDHCRFVGKVGR